jgi:hypothetical protein
MEVEHDDRTNAGLSALRRGCGGDAWPSSVMLTAAGANAGILKGLSVALIAW